MHAMRGASHAIIETSCRKAFRQLQEDLTRPSPSIPHHHPLTLLLFTEPPKAQQLITHLAPCLNPTPPKKQQLMTSIYPLTKTLSAS